MVKYVLLMLLIQKLQISRLSKKYYVLLHIIPSKGSHRLLLNAKKADITIAANEKEKDVYHPYHHSIDLARRRGLLYILPYISCKTYGQVCHWHGNLLCN